MYFYLTTIAVSFVTYKIYQKLSCGMCDCNTKLTGKTIIVTGSNTGIGFETAKDLAKRGAKVILACRNEEKGLIAKEAIIKETKNENIIYKRLDLTSFQSVRDFANDIIATENSVHILINNAGAGKQDNSLTEDNVVIEAQVNHFSPFLLTLLLLPKIKESAPSRIINVSSLMHKFGTIDLETFYKPADNFLKHSRVYSNTKLANILFTTKLSEILKGSKVTVNSVHPGVVNTDIFGDRSRFVRFLIGLCFKTSYEGAQTSIYLAVSPELDNITGKYFADCKEATPSKQSQNLDLANKLWTLSEEICKIKYNEVLK